MAVTAAPAAARLDRRRWVALVVVCLAMLMNALDGSIVNVALPDIQRSLHFSQANLTWVVDAYLISFGSFLLMAGRLGDLIGRKKVFMSGVTLFTLASVVCGAETTLPSSTIAKSSSGLLVVALVKYLLYMVEVSWAKALAPALLRPKLITFWLLVVSRPALTELSSVPTTLATSSTYLLPLESQDTIWLPWASQRFELSW